MYFLVEGGNIWPDVVTNFDPREVGKPFTQATQKYIDPLGARVNTIGSCYKPRFDKSGQCVPSNDLDAMVDLAVLQHVFQTTDAKTTRKALNDYLQKQGLETKQAGVTVHTRVPLGGNFYQVDIKVVPNAAKVAQFHRHDIPKGSPYKGVNKQMMMNTLASTQGMLWSPDEGLYARDSAGKKAQLLSADWDQIAKYLLGKQATGKDLGSVESILNAIPDEQKRLAVFNAAKDSRSWQSATPTVTEWFRKAMDMLK